MDDWNYSRNLLLPELIEDPERWWKWQKTCQKWHFWSLLFVHQKV